MQHLDSITIEEDVADGLPDEDLLYRCRQGVDVGSLAERRVSDGDWPSLLPQSHIDSEHVVADRRYQTAGEEALITTTVA